MTSPAVRPPTVTLACVFLGMTSALWLFYAGSLLSSWTSLGTQQQLRETFADASLPGGIENQLEIARVALMASAAAAAAAVILAIYAARGHRPSRILLTAQAAVLAVVFGIAGVQGLIPSAFAIACIFLLWNAEARRWFAAVNGSPSAAADPPLIADRAEAGAGPGSAPEPEHSELRGERSDRPEAPPAPRDIAVTPRPVTSAAIITILGSTFGVLIGSLLYVLGSRFGPQIEEQLRTDSTFGGLYAALDDGVLAQMMTTLGGSMAALSLLGILAAVLLLNRRAVGRTLLYIASAGTIAMTLVTLPVGLVTGGLAIYVIVLLSKAEVRAWLTSR